MTSTQPRRRPSSSPGGAAGLSRPPRPGLGAPESWHRAQIADQIDKVDYNLAVVRSALAESACPQAIAGIIQAARSYGEMAASVAAMAPLDRGTVRAARHVEDVVRQTGLHVISTCAIGGREGNGT